MLPLPSHPSSRSRLSLLTPYRRPFFSFGGAIIAGYFTLSPLLQPTEKAIAVTPIEEADAPLVFPASATMIVQPKAALGARVEGKITLAADIVGRAPVGGAVAKWLVEPGQRVRKGQPVVQISSGSAVKRAPVAEVHQDRAERAQIEAAQGQLELSRQMALAQSQLRVAQDRVKKAQAKVADARALISQLQNSEPASPKNFAPGPKTVSVPNPARAQAEAELKNAQNAASESRAAQKIAEAEIKSAQKSLADAQKAATSAEAKVGQVERDFDAGKATGADVQAARSDKEDALSKIAGAQSRLDAAKKESEARAKSSAPLLAKVDAAKKALEAIPSTVSVTQTAAPDEPESSGDADPAALGEAIARAQKALEESRAAAREAEKLAARVKSYEGRAHASNQEIESASQQLENAQQRVLDSVPRPVFTRANAPQSGTVVWISRLATEVGAGDRVFGVSLGDRYKVRLNVSGDQWKRVKVGDKLPATLGDSSDPKPLPIATVAGPRQLDSAKVAQDITFDPSAPKAPQSVPIVVVVKEINAPENESDGDATIEGDLEILADSNVSPKEAQVVSAFLPSEGAPKMMVPISSLVNNDGKNFVALLRDDANPNDEIFEMSWQRVKLGRSIGTEREVEQLPVGSRILTQPLSLLPNATPIEGQTSPVSIQNA